MDRIFLPHVAIRFKSSLGSQGKKNRSSIVSFRIHIRDQIWTSQNTKTDASLFNQGEGNRILIPSEKSLGAIDRVKGPEPFCWIL